MVFAGSMRPERTRSRRRAQQGVVSPSYRKRSVIFTSSTVPIAEFQRVTGWQSKAEGLCRAERCVPFRSADTATIELVAAAEALAMPLVHDEAHGLWAVGAEIGGRALHSAVAPELELPEFRGGSFRLSSLRGTKVLLVAWASW